MCDDVNGHLPFEHGSLHISIAGSKERVHNTWQEDKESNQKVAQFASLQMLVKASADENRESYDPHWAVPEQRACHCRSAACKRFGSPARTTHDFAYAMRTQSHKILKISAHLLDASSGSHRSRLIPQHMLGDAAGLGVARAARTGETTRLRIEFTRSTLQLLRFSTSFDITTWPICCLCQI